MFLLLVLYILNGNPVLKQEKFADPEACGKAGMALVQELQANPSVDDILFGACYVTPDGQNL
jgi:hypothetical protein